MEALLKAYWLKKGYSHINSDDIQIKQFKGETVYYVETAFGLPLFVRTQDLLVFLFERQA